MDLNAVKKAARRLRKHDKKGLDPMRGMGDALWKSFVLRWELEQQIVAARDAGIASAEIVRVVDMTDYDIGKVEQLRRRDPPSERQRSLLRGFN